MILFTLENYLRFNEGVEHTAYDDATGKPVPPGGKAVGVLTIGVGHTGADVTAGLVWSDAEIAAHLQRDMARATAWAAQDVGARCWPRVDAVRRIALADMAYEMGGRGLLGFEMMIAAVRRFDWLEAGAAARASEYDRREHGRAERNAAMIATGVAFVIPGAGQPVV